MQVISSEPETLDKQFCLDEFKELHNSLAYIQANQKTILEAKNHILEVLTDKPKKKLSSEETNFQIKRKVNCLILAILTILLLLALITGLVIYGIYMLVTWNKMAKTNEYLKSLKLVNFGGFRFRSTDELEKGIEIRDYLKRFDQALTTLNIEDP